MTQLEFFTLNNEVWYRVDGSCRKLNVGDIIIDELLDILVEMYPNAYRALDKEYKGIEDLGLKRFRMVARFCKCNFGNIDNVFDIQSNRKFVFEEVACPLRGECRHENVICNPAFNSRISKREMAVLHLLYQGKSNSEIAEKLYLSSATVHNHIANAYARIGVHSKSEFIEYARSNNLFPAERIGDKND